MVLRGGPRRYATKDINALLSKVTPQQILDFSYAYSRQGNIYAGDTQYSNSNMSPNGLVDTLYGQETNRLYRQTWGLTYNGIWDWGSRRRASLRKNQQYPPAGGHHRPR